MSSTLGPKARSVAGWLLVAGVLFLAWPAQLGGHLSLVVVSGHSMDGTYRTNDLLLVWPHSDYDTGDIVVYQIPKGEPASGQRVVHRVIAKENGHFTTQGDNRPTADIWHPMVTDVVGQPLLRLPAGGLVLRWFLSPIALALLCAVCVYLAVLRKDDGTKKSEPQDSGPLAIEPQQSELLTIEPLDMEPLDMEPLAIAARSPESAGDARPGVEDALVLAPPRVVSLVACQTITPHGGTGSAS